MTQTKDAILVDDYSGNLREWEKEGGIGVKFSKNEIDEHFKTINKLNQLMELFS